MSVLFDPQTAGGLLAAAPADVVPDLLDALKSLGYAECAVIGRCVSRERGDLSDQQPIAIKSQKAQ